MGSVDSIRLPDTIKSESFQLQATLRQQPTTDLSTSTVGA
ncbi:hypothetical protein PL8927_760046 [Planktothrix serta PCC 8927]|uniref:Uncharacterized protein n=1 Tax=Planktothrix serta PCC 8927 TaxID=671068 RepID=A0A7Z9E1S4_9CYAN|nr:hypothetical protein PL8927_760046 [Planktothrix serta PCC 8927]